MGPCPSTPTLHGSALPLLPEATRAAEKHLLGDELRPSPLRATPAFPSVQTGSSPTRRPHICATLSRVLLSIPGDRNRDAGLRYPGGIVSRGPKTHRERLDPLTGVISVLVRGLCVVFGARPPGVCPLGLRPRGRTSRVPSA